MAEHIKHSDREHALLSASGAVRWLACTPSARLEDQFADKDTSYSLEGTRAHELAERTLQGYLFGKRVEAWAEFQQAIKESPELTETGAYIEYVLNSFRTKEEELKAPVLFLETRLDFSEWVPEGFGTGDVVMVYGSTVEIIDLKYGKGVPVDAYQNPQLMLYGLGAYQFVKDVYDIDNVKMTIVQPRLDSVTQYEMPLEDLIRWAETEVKTKAALAFNGDGVYQIGDHCRFCKAAAVCQARANHNLEVARHDFATTDTLTNEQVAAILPRLDDLVKWAKTLQEHALNELLAGRDIPGYKVVEGRSVRKITNEDGLANALIEAGTPEAMLYERKLYGITALEKIIGKKKFTELSKGYVSKPQGAPTLAPADDPRQAIANNAAYVSLADFEEIEWNQK